MQSITLIVLLLAMIALLTVGISTKRQIENEREQAIAEVRSANQVRVSAFEQYVYRTLGSAELAARHASFLYRNGFTSDRQRLTADPVLSTPLFDGVAIKVGKRYQVLTGAPALDAKTIAQLEAVVRTGSGDIVVAAPIPTLDGSQQIPLLHPLNSREDFVVVLIDYRRFTDFAQDIHLRQNELISLIGLDGVTRARRTGASLSAGEKVAGLVMRRQFTNPNGSYVGPSVLDGIPRFFTHRRLAKYGLFVTSGIPLETVASQMVRRRFATFAIMAASMTAIIIATILLLILVVRRDRMLRQLLEANYKLNEAQRLGNMGDWDYYPDEDRFTFSRNLGRMYGALNDTAEVGLRALTRYISPPELRRVEENIRHVITTGEPCQWELEVEHGPNDTRVHRVIATPIRDPKGRILGVHGADQDITNETVVRSLERRVADLARLDSMKAMTATLAHELNHPLAIASNYAAAALRLMTSKGVVPKVAYYLGACQQQIEHLATIVSSARDLVAPSSRPGETGSLTNVIQDVRLMLQSGPRGNEVAFVAQVHPDADRITANLAQLKQVLFNLARNGVDAAPPGSRPMLKLTVTASAEEHTFHLVDNGDGISGLSDPFAALATSKSNGLGLGLSIARTIVEAHGGKIWIQRTGPEGTSIVFTILGSS